MPRKYTPIPGPQTIIKVDLQDSETAWQSILDLNLLLTKLAAISVYDADGFTFSQLGTYVLFHYGIDKIRVNGGTDG